MPDRKNLFILAFLAVQLLLPIRGFVHDKYETRADFSWNMYSKRYRCWVEYDVVIPEGKVLEIDHESYFVRPERAMMAFHLDALPRFHSFLCNDLRRQDRLGILFGSVECSLNDAPRRPLVQTGADLCTAPNFGVAHP